VPAAVRIVDVPAADRVRDTGVPTVLLVGDDDSGTAAAGAACRLRPGAVVAWPEDRDRLSAVVAELLVAARSAATATCTLRVGGASGGVGTSTIVLALAGLIGWSGRHTLAAVRPGGLAVVHVLNLWHLPDGPCQWQKCRRMTGPDGELLVVKGVHRSGASGYVDLVVTTLDETPRLKTESVPLLGLEADALERAARRGGATQVDVYGGYDSRVYERETSADLIMVARRGE
jgi:hypothetical protein